MRILIIGSELHPPPTNMESQMLACLKAMPPGKSFNIRALSIRINKSAISDDSFKYVIGLNSGPLVLRKLFYAVELLIRVEQEIRRGLDLVHFIWVGFPFITQYIIRRLSRRDIKIVYTVLSSASPPDRYRGAHRIIVSTQETRSRYMQAGFTPNQIVLIPPPVNRKVFRSSECPPEPYFVCASGPFTQSQFHQRGVSILFQSFAKLNSQNISVDLKYYGRWPRGHQMLKYFAEKYGATNVYVKTGYVQNLPYVIRHSSGVIIPYIDTGDAPLSALEAICCGRPVIITRGPGLAADIDYFGAGCVVDPTPDAIAEAVKIILSNPEHYNRNARKMAKFYDADNYRFAHLAVYDQLKASTSNENPS
jgi:glycosyltransferase involved in cell wall biosynthesis